MHLISACCPPLLQWPDVFLQESFVLQIICTVVTTGLPSQAHLLPQVKTGQPQMDCSNPGDIFSKNAIPESILSTRSWIDFLNSLELFTQKKSNT